MFDVDGWLLGSQFCLLECWERNSNQRSECFEFQASIFRIGARRSFTRPIQEDMATQAEQPASAVNIA